MPISDAYAEGHAAGYAEGYNDGYTDAEHALAEAQEPWHGKATGSM